jgi:hypothetical protein
MSRTTITAILGVVAAAALVLAGCDGGGSPTEPDEMSQLSGRWEGTARTIIPPIFNYPAHMTLSGQTPSGRVGTSEYPSLGCRAGLYREGAGSEFVVRERLEQGDCADGGSIRVSLDAAKGTLAWSWYFADGRLGATATLDRM